jgi:hypothetical protein
MPTKTITCPKCGLVVRELRDATGTRLIYDINDWHSRRRRLDLDDPRGASFFVAMPA